MNCPYCGSPLQPNDAFCPNCGAKTETPAPAPQDASAVTVKKKPFANMSVSHRIAAICCVVITIALIIAVLCGIFRSSEPKEVVKDYYDAIEDCDAEDLLELVPKTYLKELMEDKDLSRGELEDAVQDYMDRYYDDYDKIRVSFEGKETLDKDDFAAYFDTDEYDNLTVKKAVEYELKVRYTSDDGDQVETQEEEFLVFQYKGDWYSMDAMFLTSMALYL